MINDILSFSINQDFRLDRWIHFQKQIKRYGLEFLNTKHKTPVSRHYLSTTKRFKRTKLSEMSNVHTFGECIKEARACKAKMVLTFEDDVYFIDKDSASIIKNVLEELPDKFGVCYLGCYIRSKPSKCSIVKHSAYLLQLKGVKFSIWGAHAVIWHESIYDLVIDEIFNTSKPMITDSLIYKKIVNGGVHNCFVAKPMIAFQNGELASNSMHGNFPFEKMKERSLKVIC